MKGDDDMTVVSFLINKGHDFDYIFSLNEYEKMIIKGVIDANYEMERRKWE